MFFWHQLTGVILDKAPLNGLCLLLFVERETWKSDNRRTGNITKMTTKMPEHLMEANQLPKEAMEWFLATGRKRLHPRQGSAAADKPRMTRCITANVLQTNKVDAQGDKLVTELS